MSKHTPGPWKVTRRGIMAVNPQTGRYGAVVCQPNWRGVEPDDIWLDVPREANARLISAAPDLLEQLKECCTDLMIAADNARHAAKTDPRWEGVAEKLMERVYEGRAAIAKAEGKDDAAC